MLTVCMGSSKGGVSKTTLAYHLAVEAEIRGSGPVAMVDYDPQQSLAAWWRTRAAETPILLDPAIRLDEVREQGVVELLFIDTPPRTVGLVAELIAQSDLVLIPVKASVHDLRSVGSTIQLCEELRKPFIFIVTMTIQRARLNADVARELAQHGLVAPTNMANRTDYAQSASDGRVISELDPGGKGASEISALWTYIHSRLTRTRTTEAAAA
jgi:chromosome partitioning protein